MHGGAWATKKCAQDGFWPDIAIWPGWTSSPTVQCFPISYLGNVLGVNAVDGVADVLLGRHDQGEGEHAGRGHAGDDGK